MSIKTSFQLPINDSQLAMHYQLANSHEAQNRQSLTANLLQMANGKLLIEAGGVL